VQARDREKLNASKARCSGLEAEGAKLRKQLKTVLGKGTGDDALIDALRQELKAVRVRWCGARGHARGGAPCCHGSRCSGFIPKIPTEAVS